MIIETFLGKSFCPDPKIDNSHAFDECRERGLGGGWLKVGAEEPVNFCSIERPCGQRLPPDAFFGSFLVRVQEMNT